ncbi:hypothetical protein TI04_09075 [Achromatium sp. WMS2]|nr:hypothetical protein TI04_09075 [Achromatium sp. WMS2]
MFINGMVFVTTISRNIQYCTVLWVQNKEEQSYCISLEQVMEVYHRAGFVVEQISADNKFAPIL